MVRLGADRCAAFALSWDSGTGHCARLARDAGILTADFGVDTTREARPLPDGLYRVVSEGMCAGFTVVDGDVDLCAPVLRRRIDYWWTVARKVG
jgi:hypothetical protein